MKESETRVNVKRKRVNGGTIPISIRNHVSRVVNIRF